MRFAPHRRSAQAGGRLRCGANQRSWRPSPRFGILPSSSQQTIREAAMDKERVAAILDEIGTLLELKGETVFRVNAYRNGARTIEQLETTLADVVAAGKLGDIRGIGDTL